MVDSLIVDTRRMNVALTRAKSSMFILGHAPTLERSDEIWRKIVHDARSRALLCDVGILAFDLLVLMDPRSMCSILRPAMQHPKCH
jgi:hypothetical protein